MALSLITAPVTHPVSLDEVKTHLRIDTSDDDTYLTSLLSASVQHLEQAAGLKLLTQSWRQYFDCAQSGGIFRLEVAPVQHVLAMRVFDDRGNPVVVAESSLELDRISHPARLLVTGLPQVGQAFNGIEIDIVAGFGDTPVEVPDGLKRALLLLVAHAYEFRGAVPLGQQPASEPQGFRTLLAPFRRLKL